MSVMIGKSNLMNRMAKVSNMATRVCVYIYTHTYISVCVCVCVVIVTMTTSRTYCCFVCWLLALSYFSRLCAEATCTCTAALVNLLMFLVLLSLEPAVARLL